MKNTQKSTQNNLQKVLKEIKTEFKNLEIISHRNNFSIEKGEITEGFISNFNNKLVIFNREKNKFVKISSYKKIKEVIENNIILYLFEKNQKQNQKRLKNELQNINYIVENYNIFEEGINGVYLTPKNYDKVFSILVKKFSENNEDINKTYLKFQNDEIPYNEMDKVKEAINEMEKIKELI